MTDAAKQAEALRKIADAGRSRFPQVPRTRKLPDGRSGTVVETRSQDSPLARAPFGRVNSAAIRVNSVEDIRRQGPEADIQNVRSIPVKDMDDLASGFDLIQKVAAHRMTGKLLTQDAEAIAKQVASGFGSSATRSRGVSPRIDRDVTPAKAGVQSLDSRLRGNDNTSGIVVVRASQASASNISTLIGFVASSAHKGVLVVQDNGSAGSAFIAEMQRELAKYKAYGVRDRIHFLHLQGALFNEKVHSLLANGAQGQGVLGVMAKQLGINGDFINRVVVVSPEVIEGAWTLKLDLNQLSPDIAARRLDVASFLGLEAAGFGFNLSGSTLLNQVMDVNAQRRQVQVNFDAMGNAELLRLSEQLRAQLSVLIAA